MRGSTLIVLKTASILSPNGNKAVSRYPCRLRNLQPKAPLSERRNGRYLSLRSVTLYYYFFTRLSTTLKDYCAQKYLLIGAQQCIIERVKKY